MSPSSPTPDLTIRTVSSQSTVVLFLDGDLDLATADKLTQSIQEATSQTSELILDLSAVSFIDSSGLTVITRAAATAQSAGRRLRLRRTPPRVLRVLELTGMIDGFAFE